MKTKNLIMPGIFIAMIFMSLSAFSQQRFERRQDCPRFNDERPMRGMAADDDDDFLPGLTDEQADKIHEIRMKTMKDIQPLENKINEKEAQMTTLTSNDKVDFDKVDQLIDEISTLRGKIAKTQARCHQKIREQLTDEQKMIFDKRPRGNGGKGPFHDYGRHARMRNRTW